MTQSSPMGTPVPWNLVAPAYAEEVVPMFEPFAKDALELAAPPAGARVVDVACGPGTLAALASRAGLHVDAIDFSPAMIERLESRHVANVTSRVADGQALPFPDGTFAAGFSMFGLMFFPDRAKGFAELARVLAPGARAVVATWTPIESVPALGAMFGALREAMGKVLGPQAPVAKQEMALSTEDACRAEMGAAFRTVEIHRITHGRSYPSADALWSSLERTLAPLVLMKQALGDDKWAPLADAAQTAIRLSVGAGAHELALTAFVSVGNR